MTVRPENRALITFPVWKPSNSLLGELLSLKKIKMRKAPVLMSKTVRCYLGSFDFFFDLCLHDPKQNRAMPRHGRLSPDKSSI